MHQLFCRKITLTFAFIFLLRLTYAQEATKMTLDEAIKYALENSNGIKSTKLGIKNLDLQIEANTASALPQVTASAGFNYYYQTPQMNQKK